MDQEAKSCPVCTLYLRPGISLLVHLNTHPKKHIIKALLTLSNQTPPSLFKAIEQLENHSDDGSSVSSASCHSFTFNTQEEEANNTDRYSSNNYQSVKSESGEALSEIIQDLVEDFPENDIDIEDNNINFEDNPPEFVEDRADGIIHFQCESNETNHHQGESNETIQNQGESNESIRHQEESEEMGLSIIRTINNESYESNENVTVNEEYESDYIYSENDSIIQIEPDPHLNFPQYSTLTTVELHPEYLSSNNQEHQLTLDIQTDELMPAHGELSGQESLEPPEPILASIWTMKSSEPSQPQTSITWDDTVHEVSTAARNLMLLKNSEEIPKHTIEKKEVIPSLGKLICPYCKLNFNMFKERKVHIDEEHKSEESIKKGLMYIKPILTKTENGVDESAFQSFKFECGICNLAFEDYINMTLHFIDTHKDKIHLCPTCNIVFPTVTVFREHILNVHPLTCSFCPKKFQSQFKLTTHIKRHLQIKPYVCNQCHKCFESRVRLQDHMNGHLNIKPYPCTSCHLSFRSKAFLSSHMRKQHSGITISKDFYCHCGEIFTSIKKLEWHKETHEEKPKQCQWCSERFVHSSSLTRHIRISHDATYLPSKDRDAENMNCHICNNVFLRKSFATHMRIHNDLRPYSCNICTTSFRTKWNLRMHQWTHMSRAHKPFKCTQCNSAFYLKPELEAHVRSHNGIRPFTCNECGKQFVRKKHCMRHMAEHNESNRSYECKECGKKFHRSYYLTDHLKTHNGIKPHTCHICGKTTSSKSNHNKHVRTHHARDPVNTEG